MVMQLTGCQPLPPSDVLSTPNPIAAYLSGAEIQAESAQAGNLCRALQDLATFPPAELRRSRYADYQGRPASWDLPTVLRRHFVPDTSSKHLPEGEEFWRHVDASSVRSAARQLYATRKCGSS